MTEKAAQYWRRKSEEGKQASTDSYHYRKHMIQLLQNRIAFTAYCCTLVDPDTLCSIGAVTEHSVEVIHQQILKLEYDQADMHHYTDMLRNKVSVARLSDRLAGERSARYEEVLRPHGFSDELRCALIHQEKCYGFLTLFKNQDALQPLFTDEELEQLKHVGPIMGEALQGYYLSVIDTQDGFVDQAHDQGQGKGQEQGQEQGVMIVDHHLHIQSLNTKASLVLDTLRKLESIRAPHLPKPLQVMGLRLLAQQHPPAPILVPIPGQGYLAVQVSLLHSVQANARHIAFSFNEAAPKEMLAYLIKAYHLTAREQEVVREIMKGHATKEIAQCLAISYHTAQDHLKAIFQKVQVTNRNELVWKLLAKYQIGS